MGITIILECNADHENWTDSTGETCELYSAGAYCTSAGELGTGWAASWGDLEAWSNNGLSGWTCPPCGCVNPVTPLVRVVKMAYPGYAKILYNFRIL